ncbi:MAG: acetyl-CoA carboxylase biotin carboxylase subunit [Thermomicrobiales bacterium]|nr:acetyl-CoA carboxylase biotin carboxylase subunit [Thermomicrobiales bacterium]
MAGVRKVLIANRGEIAVRILRACRELGIGAVVAYSEADRDSLAVRLADEAVCIGPAQSARSYTNIPALMSAALVTGCDALHPGYGFLAENAYLAEICQQLGITFVGPPPDVIAKMGDKAVARQIMKQSGVPTVPGSEGVVRDLASAKEAIRRIGYPALIKAVAGGGGRGMRVVTSEGELTRLFSIAQQEAETNFGSGDVYIERYVDKPRHVEVQILADRHGHIYAIGERDCSLQRRHQKLVEEAPAPNLNKKVRDNLLRAAIKGAKAVGYQNAGTLEFLVDASGNFYFMEMNTRIQVEHPVTERVYGLDLVAWQLQIAAGAELKLDNKDLVPHGHSIEVRITAEDPAADFQPGAGTVDTVVLPGGPGIRVDTHLYPGYRVPPDYDSLLAKIISWGETRDQAVNRMDRALAETFISGIPNTTSFLRLLVTDGGFRRGDVHTGYVAEFMHRNAAIISRLGDGLPASAGWNP